MKTIVATIKPVHLGNIRSGRKAYEMRKSCPKEAPFRVMCCESGSGGKILAEFEVHGPVKVRPLIWPELVHAACVTMAEAEVYAKGKDLWFWDIHNMVDYCTVKGHSVKHISDFGLKRAPQSWCYVKEK